MPNAMAGAKGHEGKIAESENALWRQRPVKLLCRIIYTDRYMRDIRICAGMVNNLSEDGAIVDPNGAKLPDEFFISFGDDDVIFGAMIQRRSGRGTHVRFMQIVPTLLIDCIAALENPYSGAKAPAGSGPSELGALAGSYGSVRTQYRRRLS